MLCHTFRVLQRPIIDEDLAAAQLQHPIDRRPRHATCPDHECC